MRKRHKTHLKPQKGMTYEDRKLDALRREVLSQDDVDKPTYERFKKT